MKTSNVQKVSTGSQAIMTVTVDVAPREVAGLFALGRFPLRVLAYELKLMDTEEAKMDFIIQDRLRMARSVARALLKRDYRRLKAKLKAGGG